MERSKLKSSVSSSLFRGLFLPSLLLAAILPALSHKQISQHAFWIANDTFWKDGERFRIMGGDMHYFRVHPEYWEDRLRRAKALGLNTIQAYVAWNLHEPRQGEIHFDGHADLEGFLKLAQKLDLLVMLRIGPYICAEWDLGGFPSWLLAQNPPLQLRSSDPRYLELVHSWWDILLPKLTPLLYCNGGPIIMVQIENEYGSYGDDKAYLKQLALHAREHFGDDIILYTTDGGVQENLKKGTLPGFNIYAAIDFSTGEDPAPKFSLQKQFNAPGMSPSLTAEFYTGWLTHWAEKLATTDAFYTASELEKVLNLNGSVVLYMAHGGTNFGFSSGANTGADASDYKADITSYDYDAPIGEAGDVDSLKFKEIRRVLAKYSLAAVPDVPPLPLRQAYGKLNLKRVSSLFHVLETIADPPCNALNVESMEALNQISGFTLYRATLPAHSKPGSVLSIPQVHDRAQVFVWGTSKNRRQEHYNIGIVNRWSNQPLTLPDYASSPGSTLDILVENMGRVNYGPFLHDLKGLLSPVSLDGIKISGWRMYPIPLNNISKLEALDTEISQTGQFCILGVVLKSKTTEKNEFTIAGNQFDGPGFYKATLSIRGSQKPADTFLSMEGWTKGLAFINGFNLGRYWPSVGPQCTLYIPSPLLKHRDNELIIFELERPQSNLQVEFFDKHSFTCGA